MAPDGKGSLVLRRGLLAAAVVLSGWLLLRASLSDDPPRPPAPPGELPPQARPELVEQLRADRDAPRHPADGGGRAWLIDPEPAVAGTHGRWTIAFEAGPLGVALGGAVTLQTSPFWRWSPAWADAGGPSPDPWRDERPGYTTVTTDADAVDLSVHTGGSGLVVVSIGGRPLAAGEQIRFVYGAGAALARADDFAEAGSPFLLGVDGDGDGVRGLLADPPRIDVHPGPAAQVVAHLPSVLAPGAEGLLTLAVLDRAGNAGVEFAGRFTLDGLAPGASLPLEVQLLPADGGSRRIPFRCDHEGVYRVRVSGPEGLATVSNPLSVQAGEEPILWGDLHGHSQLSDGTGTPEAYYRYARDVAGLDLAALTDHDHWGFRFLDAAPDLWEQIVEASETFHAPGSFVTLLGYEWTSWIHGHRHVLAFDEQPALSVLSSLDERYESPRQLWDALAGRDVLTFAHHSAGGPIATNWDIPPDPVLEPVTEVVSVHGSSEGPDGPGRIYAPVAGHSVREALGRGYRLGFIGSGDGHDGHPGLAHLASPGGIGGLAAVLTGERTRAGVLAALRQRRCYATSGARILLRASLDGQRMGSVMAPGETPAELAVRVCGTAPIAAVEVIRGLDVVAREEPGSAVLDLLTGFTLAPLRAGEVVYLRVLQVDGQLAVGSPFFVASR